MIEESQLFLVRSDSLAYPVFYVEACDILEATRIAKEIVDSYKAERVVGSVSTIDIPLLRLGEE